MTVAWALPPWQRAVGRVRCNPQSRSVDATNQPDSRAPAEPLAKSGQISSVYRNLVKPQDKKYFCFIELQISAYPQPSRPTQRGVGHRHNEGRVAVDAEVV